MGVKGLKIITARKGGCHSAPFKDYTSDKQWGCQSLPNWGGEVIRPISYPVNSYCGTTRNICLPIPLNWKDSSLRWRVQWCYSRLH